MESIQVLLATYQGADFVEAQIASLLQQNYSHVSIFARDDGSNDKTHTILDSYAAKGKLQWITGENIGVVRSFDILLRQAEQAAYYAYCDQDDVWLPNKLSRAADSISQLPQDIPLLYFTQTELVDENLKSLHIIQPQIHKPLVFGHALVQNVVTGCTLVINHAARKLLTDIEPNWKQIHMHDWWAYQIIAAHGRIIYDPYPSVKYRQHGKNQIGVKNLRLEKRLKRFWNNDRIITNQAAELYRCFSHTMPQDKRELLENFLAKDNSLMKRIQLAIEGDIYRQKTKDDILFKLLLLFNRL
jgi:glycosyltransferase involved in cell wall biosynthesis